MNKVFLFPGYGSQCVGMGKEFYDHYRSVQELFEEASHCLGINFVKLCFASSERELAKPMHAYLALFVAQSSIYTVLLEHGITPSLVTGWGVGYASAHYAAGVLNFPDGLYIIHKYMTFFNELARDSQVDTFRVRGIARAQLEYFFKQTGVAGDVQIGIVCAEDDYIIIGAARSIAILQKLLGRELGVVITSEPLVYALHLLFRHEMIKRMNSYLEKIDCKPPRYPLLNHEGHVLAIKQPLAKTAITAFMYEPIDIPRVVRSVGVCDVLVQIGPSLFSPRAASAYLPNTRVKIIEQRKDIADIGNIQDI
jgi:[acyl-carrier-protein] S-malonyltransferase